MTAKLGFLGRTLPLTALFFVAGCGAMEGSWPNLAGDPPAEPVALLDPVRLPEPRTEMAAISPQEARALLEALPQRQNVLSQQLHDARSRYESAKAAIGTQQPERLQGVDYRTAQFALSR
ncbi:hypothetical protein JCM17844_27730 [Iodidimonas gelatinilytica]|uniref:Uncharacterized protein n=1 Tax=Iodidimonas gelatinilytica TaxID=1236966 RepID=A0A5A7MTK1_9PROT|nr:hypothetical protein [Iodidimonas gelatinilytica]GEQ99136.1 hypothetical protein JCM17844_27730 [Iodidimonas gelatinilytica]GER01993.1 hypothetical protein JCM17845_26160 [Iodidimonas gelatinilytica]